jgi:hypothetical protein
VTDHWSAASVPVGRRAVGSAGGRDGAVERPHPGREGKGVELDGPPHDCSRVRLSGAAQAGASLDLLVSSARGEVTLLHAGLWYLRRCLCRLQPAPHEGSASRSGGVAAAATRQALPRAFRSHRVRCARENARALVRERICVIRVPSEQAEDVEDTTDECLDAVRTVGRVVRDGPTVHADVASTLVRRRLRFLLSARRTDSAPHSSLPPTASSARRPMKSSSASWRR